MQFSEIINAKYSKMPDRSLMQKEVFSITPGLRQYLVGNGRGLSIPVSYNDLLFYSHANALRDKNGKLTHWETAVYDDQIKRQLNSSLVNTYSILKKRSEPEFGRQLKIERVDFCEFGNSIPFRITVSVNSPEQLEVFYVKFADASRIYGLELEHLLSPDLTNFICYNDTLVEEHIEGVAGDIFIKNLKLDEYNSRKLAKEFVQFNERCFARLLGDMRSYNFVVQAQLTSDLTVRIRAIDFDQQSYEGNKNLYLPQFFKENFQYADLVLQMLDSREIMQFQAAERYHIRERVVLNKKRLMSLLNAMTKDELSESYKVVLLRKELNSHFKTNGFSHCKTMGAIVKRQLKQVLLG